jgi:hypothetical protein
MSEVYAVSLNVVYRDNNEMYFLDQTTKAIIHSLLLKRDTVQTLLDLLDRLSFPT